jgi:hypothetical protein
MTCYLRGGNISVDAKHRENQVKYAM